MRNEKQNVGVEYATVAAAEVGAKLVIPPDPGDVNDYWQNHDDEEVVALVESGGYVSKEEDPIQIAEDVPSDVTFSDMFVRQHKRDIRFSENGGRVWDGNRWAADIDGRIQEMAKDTARSIFDAAKEAKTTSDQIALAKWGTRQLQKPRLDAGIALAMSHSDVRIRTSAFDADEMLFNCANGTLNLATGELRDHRRSDLITKLGGTHYDEDAKCERFEDFLREIFDGDDERIEFIQRDTGYTLTGRTSEQCLNLCYGVGANGKSVLLEIIRELTGDYGISASIETFMAHQRGRGVPNDIARLVGSRFVAVGETPQKGLLNESLIKDVTGGDTITARFLNKEFFEFRPQFKLWIRANHKPSVRGTDQGIWRRINLIPFDVTIPRKRRDPHLIQKLRKELPGILGWAVRGCQKWQESGLKAPTAVRNATRKYRREQDVLRDFLKDCTRKSDRYVMANALYTAYSDWCGDNGERAVSQKEFVAAMEERGYHRKRIKKGNAWMNMQLRVRV